MADDIKDPQEVKEATEAIKGYVEAMKELQATEEQRALAEASARGKAELYLEIESVESRNNLLDKQISKINEQIAALGAKDSAEMKSLEAQRSAYSEIKDLSAEQADAVVDSLQKQGDMFGVAKEQLEGFATMVEPMFQQMSEAITGNLGSIAAAFALFKMNIIPSVKDIKDFALEMDDARRGMIPYIRTVDGAAKSQGAMAEEAARLRMPLQNLIDVLPGLSGEFRRINTETPESIAALASLQAQMKQLGVEAGTASIIESMVTDQGIDTIENARVSFSALTMQMRELGVTPKELNDDFTKLIPTFSMFGAAAGTNMAQVSLMASKMKVGTEAITGFAENFAGYGDAAKAAQTINAVFGMNVIDDPAELVRTYYTEGPAGVLQMVQNSMTAAGAEIDPDSAMGRAQIRALKSLGFGSEQEVMRMLGGDDVITDEEAGKIADVTDPTAIDTPEVQQLATQFDSLTTATITLKDQVQSLRESFMVTGLDKLGLGFGEIGAIGDAVLGHLGTISNNIMNAFTVPDSFKDAVESLKEMVKSEEGLNELMKSAKELFDKIKDVFEMPAPLPPTNPSPSPTVPGGAPGTGGGGGMGDTHTHPIGGAPATGGGGGMDISHEHPVGGSPHQHAGGGGMSGLVDGGTVTTSGYVMVGEGGPEMLSLPSGAEVANTNDTTNLMDRASGAISDNSNNMAAMRTAMEQMSKRVDSLVTLMEKGSQDMGNQQVKLVVDDRKSFEAYIVTTAHDGINKKYTF